VPDTYLDTYLGDLGFRPLDLYQALYNNGAAKIA